MSKAYYNEHDPKSAAWLRELIKQGHIAPGDVDERSIEDVLPSELAGYTQCHFFAGIGVWSYALRQAGWPDDRPVWTGSCPCQPFSAAGKRGGTADERHLWPAFHWLISQRKPDVVFGEQVASKDGLAWLDTVQSDLETAGYAVGAVDLCAAGVGAPHIRQRLFFVANATGNRFTRARESGATQKGRQQKPGIAGQFPARLERRCDVGSLAYTDGQQADTANKRRFHAEPASDCTSGNLANANGSGCTRQQPEERRSDLVTVGRSATNGFWSNAEWLYCRDGKYRAVKPGTFPLAHGAAARVGRLRGYGNAIVAPVAEAFIRAYMDR